MTCKSKKVGSWSHTGTLVKGDAKGAAGTCHWRTCVWGNRSCLSVLRATGTKSNAYDPINRVNMSRANDLCFHVKQPSSKKMEAETSVTIFPCSISLTSTYHAEAATAAARQSKNNRRESKLPTYRSNRLRRTRSPSTHPLHNLNQHLHPAQSPPWPLHLPWRWPPRLAFCLRLPLWHDLLLRSPQHHRHLPSLHLHAPAQRLQLCGCGLDFRAVSLRRVRQWDTDGAGVWFTWTEMADVRGIGVFGRVYDVAEFLWESVFFCSPSSFSSFLHASRPYNPRRWISYRKPLAGGWLTYKVVFSPRIPPLHPLILRPRRSRHLLDLLPRHRLRRPFLPPTPRFRLRDRQLWRFHRRHDLPIHALDALPPSRIHMGDALSRLPIPLPPHHRNSVNRISFTKEKPPMAKGPFPGSKDLQGHDLLTHDGVSLLSRMRALHPPQLPHLLCPLRQPFPAAQLPPAHHPRRGLPFWSMVTGHISRPHRQIQYLDPDHPSLFVRNPGFLVTGCAFEFFFSFSFFYHFLALALQR